MGKSSGTSQANVTKHPTPYTENKLELLANNGGNEAAPEKAQEINQCMIHFSVRVIDATASAKPGDGVIFVPEGMFGVQILAKGHKVASYEGDLANTLLECMKLGYTYRGEVIARENATGEIVIRVIARGKR